MAATLLATHPRRRYERHRVQLRARWSEPSALSATDPVEVRDISAGGAFLRPLSETLPRPGIRIQLIVFTALGELALSLSGEVVWVGFHPSHGCFGAGIRFDAANEDIPNQVAG